jgi:aspartyl protease family protein
MLVILAALLGLTVLVVWLISDNPGTLDDRDSQIDFTRHLAWLVVLLPALALAGRYRLRAAVRDALLWLGVAGVLLVGYSYRTELSSVADRVMGEVAPRRGVVAGAGAMTFRAASDGHFHVDATVDGQTIRFMVDTGASDVVLTAADARRLGFDLGSLRFIRSYRTANGPVSGAPVTLKEVRIGPIALGAVHASVNGGDLDRSLLGMSFLGRLSAYGVENGTLTLRQ